MSENPYAPPTAPVEDVLEGGQDAVIRQEHLGQEASLSSVGLLYYLGAFFLASSSFSIFVVTGPQNPVASFPPAAVGILLLGLGLVQLVVGYGLRRLKPWARIPTMSLAVLGLFYFPVGTLINGYILYLVLNQKSRLIFSEEYQRIIEATPEIRYRTPVLLWILLGIVVLGIAAAVVVPMFAARM